jgi:phage gpG-like protein
MQKGGLVVGVLNKLAEEAERVKKQKSRAKRLSGKRVGVSVEMSGLDDAISKISKRMPVTILQKGIRSAAKILQREIKANLNSHRSSRTGSSKKWSSVVREKRAGRTTDLRDSIGYKVKLYRSGNSERVAAFVGPRRPFGNHANLVEYGSLVKLWGSDRTVRIPPRPFMRPAADSTKKQQRDAIIDTVRREWKKM